jgi:hypothetical protein
VTSDELFGFRQVISLLTRQWPYRNDEDIYENDEDIYENDEDIYGNGNEDSNGSNNNKGSNGIEDGNSNEDGNANENGDGDEDENNKTTGRKRKVTQFGGKSKKRRL